MIKSYHLPVTSDKTKKSQPVQQFMNVMNLMEYFIHLITYMYKIYLFTYYLYLVRTIDLPALCLPFQASELFLTCRLWTSEGLYSVLFCAGKHPNQIQTRRDPGKSMIYICMCIMKLQSLVHGIQQQTCWCFLRLA